MDELAYWIVDEGCREPDLVRFVEGLARRLGEHGLPLWRLSVSMPAIDPTVRALSVVWQEGQGARTFLTDHETGPVEFERSPIRLLQSEQRMEGRWNLEIGEGTATMPLLAELRAEGATEYRMYLARFSGAETALPGAAFAVATRAAGGLGPALGGTMARLVPALALAAYRFALSAHSVELLGLYIGQSTARRVFEGDVRRGRGTAIEAAILFADLRGFSRFADRHEPGSVVATLDAYLEAMADPVGAHGGEVLKLLGDGVLSVFQAFEHGAGEACRRALGAALAVRARVLTLSEERLRAGQPALAVDLALHVGAVIYGNVGGARRLDFTAIGPAVNEASRIEGLCAELGHDLLMSGSFARLSGAATVTRGAFSLRGIDRVIEIRALA